MAIVIKKEVAKDIDAYISQFPKETQLALQEVRSEINKAIPGLKETISYAIPAFKLAGKNLVYFAGYKKHIGLYPVPTNNPMFDKYFSAYKTSGKGAIQFPLNEPMPTALIAKIVKFMAREHLIRIKKATK
jgi:uncharacterized protein YdhG (YjbR/CyaY superfamily)